MGKQRSSKTLAERVLEKNRIPFQIHLYNSHERDAVKVASLLKIPAGRLFKTLVAVRARGKPVLAIIPADHTLDLKGLAATFGEKKMKMAAQAEAEKLTRLQAGGISPLALLNGNFDMVIDSACRSWESIFISAGQKGANLQIGVNDLLGLIDPTVAVISNPTAGAS